MHIVCIIVCKQTADYSKCIITYPYITKPVLFIVLVRIRSTELHLRMKYSKNVLTRKISIKLKIVFE